MYTESTIRLWMASPKRPWIWTRAFVIYLSFMTILSFSMEITNSSEFFILVPEHGSFSLYWYCFWIRSLVPLYGLRWWSSLEESSGFPLCALDRWLIVFLENFMFSLIVCWVYTFMVWLFSSCRFGTTLHHLLMSVLVSLQLCIMPFDSTWIPRTWFFLLEKKVGCLSFEIF